MEVPKDNNLLTVDEGRPRANSDPTVGAGCLLPILLPEILVEDCTDGDDHNANDQGGLFGLNATPRRRANTCPEDLFRKKNGRPPTPPPGTFRKGSRFKSGFTKPIMKESVSFTHHKLTKLTETDDVEETAQASLGASSVGRLTSSETELLESKLGNVRLGSKPCRGMTREVPRHFDRVLGESHPRNEENRSGMSPACDGDTADSGVCGNADLFRSSSSVKCRFAQNSSPAIDSKQLQAY